MLTTSPIIAVIPAKDIKRALAFYGDKLGFTRVMETPEGGVIFEAGRGTQFLVYPTSFAGTGKHTIASFLCDDIEAEVATLRDKGITFENYDFDGLKTVDGIATMGDFKGAWFTDPEGNVIAITATVPALV